MTKSSEVTLPCARASVPLARRYLVERLRGTVDDDTVHLAALLLSEVVTNAILHARTDASVHVAVEAAGVLVAVEDRCRSRPARAVRDESALSGRGLELVETLADEFGVLPTSSGKRVWFTLGGATPPGPTGWDTANLP